MTFLRIKTVCVSALIILSAATYSRAQADKLVVTHYGGALNGLPYTIALEKGYFKDAGVNITGIIGGAGGGSGVRSLLAGGSLYAEVALPAAITAARQGLDIKIINACGEGWDQIWVTRSDAPLNSANDLRGKRLAYSRPRSVSEMFLLLLLEKLGLKKSDVTLLDVGADSAGITAVETGAADLTVTTEPFLAMQIHQGGKYKIVFYGKDVLPPMTQTVGITTTAFAKSKGKELRAIIEARRKGVEYLYAHPAEAASILSSAYHLPPAVATDALQTNLQKFGKWWSAGNFDPSGLNEVLHAMNMTGELSGSVDWNSMIDQEFLPADLQRKIP